MKIKLSEVAAIIPPNTIDEHLAALIEKMLKGKTEQQVFAEPENKESHALDFLVRDRSKLLKINRGSQHKVFRGTCFCSTWSFATKIYYNRLES
jgi:hypothetical protein